jgi:iron complex transport system substrate-binding protein
MSASATTLQIFGNANEDDIIDMDDVYYTENIILGLNDRIDLADSNYDGKINMQDVTQAELLVLGSQKEITLIDQADRIVTINEPVDRVVTLFPAVMRILVHLDASDKIVGVCGRTIDYSDKMVVIQAHPEISELPNVGMYSDPSEEMILSLNPDVIFAYVGASDVADTLQENTGIPVICLNPSPTGDEYGAACGPYETWRLAGMILGKSERAEELVSYCKDEFAEIQAVTSTISDEGNPDVYFCHSHSATDITRAVTSYDPLDIADANNVAGELLASGTLTVVDVSKEQIISWDPEIILIHGFSKEPTLSIESVLSDPALQTVDAVKNNRIYYTKGWYIGWDPASGVAESYYMSKLFHPDEFADLDMEQKGNEVLKEFYGADGLYTWTLDTVGNYYTWN